MAGLVVMAVNRMPAAEVEVSADLVRRLLASQHPDLARLPVEFLANGWDNELYRVGEELVARLPRRASARRSSRTSSAGCPCSPRGCPCPSRIRNGPGYPAAVTRTPGAWCPTCRACPRRRPVPST